MCVCVWLRNCKLVNCKGFIISRFVPVWVCVCVCHRIGIMEYGDFGMGLLLVQSLHRP